MEGKIKFFNEIKGYGFIVGDDDTEYFVHITQVEEDTRLMTGDSVSFESVNTDKGVQAKDVKKI